MKNLKFGVGIARRGWVRCSEVLNTLTTEALMLWFYLTGAAILIGGEVNSDIEDEAAREGSSDAKRKGQKNPCGR
jgi:hypothetical protein